MAKKGIKIEDLARELGITSRQLINRCHEGGLSVQNSVSKLNPQSERSVRAWYAPKVDAKPDDDAGSANPSAEQA